MSSTRKLWIGLGALLVVSFGVLLWMGHEIYRKAPPVPERVVAASEALELSTAGHDGMLLTIALAYSGREEITDAVKGLLNAAAAEGRSLESVVTDLKAGDIERYLYTGGVPDPDFIIRTSGEQRLSGFLIWQAAYSEFYFCDVLWPAFRRIDFLRAVRTYQRRKRRYGR